MSKTYADISREEGREVLKKDLVQRFKDNLKFANNHVTYASNPYKELEDYILNTHYCEVRLVHNGLIMDEDLDQVLNSAIEQKQQLPELQKIKEEVQRPKRSGKEIFTQRLEQRKNLQKSNNTTKDGQGSNASSLLGHSRFGKTIEEYHRNKRNSFVEGLENEVNNDNETQR